MGVRFFKRTMSDDGKIYMLFYTPGDNYAQQVQWVNGKPDGEYETIRTIQPQFAVGGWTKVTEDANGNVVNKVMNLEAPNFKFAVTTINDSSCDMIPNITLRQAFLSIENFACFLKVWFGFQEMLFFKFVLSQIPGYTFFDEKKACEGVDECLNEVQEKYNLFFLVGIPKVANDLFYNYKEELIDLFIEVIQMTKWSFTSRITKENLMQMKADDAARMIRAGMLKYIEAKDDEYGVSARCDMKPSDYMTEQGNYSDFCGDEEEVEPLKSTTERHAGSLGTLGGAAAGAAGLAALTVGTGGVGGVVLGTGAALGALGGRAYGVHRANVAQDEREAENKMKTGKTDTATRCSKNKCLEWEITTLPNGGERKTCVNRATLSPSLINLGNKGLCPPLHEIQNNIKRRFKVQDGCCVYKPSARFRSQLNMIRGAARFADKEWSWKDAQEHLRGMVEKTLDVIEDIDANIETLEKEYEETQGRQKLRIELELNKLKKQRLKAVSSTSTIDTENTVPAIEEWQKVEKRLEQWKSSIERGDNSLPFSERLKMEFIYRSEYYLRYFFTVSEAQKNEHYRRNKALYVISFMRNVLIDSLIFMFKHPAFSMWVLELIEEYKKSLCDEIAIHANNWKLSDKSHVQEKFDHFKEHGIRAGLMALSNPKTVEKLAESVMNGVGMMKFPGLNGLSPEVQRSLTTVCTKTLSKSITNIVNTTIYTRGVAALFRILDFTNCGESMAIVSNSIKFNENAGVFYDHMVFLGEAMARGEKKLEHYQIYVGADLNKMSYNMRGGWTLAMLGALIIRAYNERNNDTIDELAILSAKDQSSRSQRIVDKLIETVKNSDHFNEFRSILAMEANAICNDKVIIEQIDKMPKHQFYDEDDNEFFTKEIDAQLKKTYKDTLKAVRNKVRDITSSDSSKVFQSEEQDAKICQYANRYRQKALNKGSEEGATEEDSRYFGYWNAENIFDVMPESVNFYENPLFANQLARLQKSMGVVFDAKSIKAIKVLQGMNRAQYDLYMRSAKPDSTFKQLVQEVRKLKLNPEDYIGGLPQSHTKDQLYDDVFNVIKADTTPSADFLQQTGIRANRIQKQRQTDHLAIAPDYDPTKDSLLKFQARDRVGMTGLKTAGVVGTIATVATGVLVAVGSITLSVPIGVIGGTLYAGAYALGSGAVIGAATGVGSVGGMYAYDSLKATLSREAYTCMTAIDKKYTEMLKATPDWEEIKTWNEKSLKMIVDEMHKMLDEEGRNWQTVDRTAALGMINDEQLGKYVFPEEYLTIGNFKRAVAAAFLNEFAKKEGGMKATTIIRKFASIDVNGCSKSSERDELERDELGGSDPTYLCEAQKWFKDNNLLDTAGEVDKLYTADHINNDNLIANIFQELEYTWLDISHAMYHIFVDGVQSRYVSYERLRQLDRLNKQQLERIQRIVENDWITGRAEGEVELTLRNTTVHVKRPSRITVEGDFEEGTEQFRQELYSKNYLSFLEASHAVLFMKNEDVQREWLYTLNPCEPNEVTASKSDYEQTTKRQDKLYRREFYRLVEAIAANYKDFVWLDDASVFKTVDTLKENFTPSHAREWIDMLIESNILYQLYAQKSSAVAFETLTKTSTPVRMIGPSKYIAPENPIDYGKHIKLRSELLDHEGYGVPYSTSPELYAPDYDKKNFRLQKENGTDIPIYNWLGPELGTDDMCQYISDTQEAQNTAYADQVCPMLSKAFNMPVREANKLILKHFQQQHGETMKELSTQQMQFLGYLIDPDQYNTVKAFCENNPYCQNKRLDGKSSVPQVEIFGFEWDGTFKQAQIPHENQ